MCFRAEDLLRPQALRAIRVDLVNLVFAVKVAPSQGVLVRKSILRQLRYQVPYDYNDDEVSDAALMEEARAREKSRLEQSQVGLIRVSDLEAGEICYLNQRRDRTSDLVGLKQVGRGDFPTVYMSLEIKVSD